MDRNPLRHLFDQAPEDRPYAGFFALSVAAFILCLPLHPYCAAANCESSSIYVLVMGWASLVTFHLAGLSWLANPLLLCSWFFLYRAERRMAMRLSGSGFVLAFVFLLNAHIPGADIGGSEPITGYGPGYILWLLSLAFAFVSATHLPPELEAAESDFAHTAEEPIMAETFVAKPHLPDDDLPTGDSDPA